jgi:myosin heavy subunit
VQRALIERDEARHARDEAFRERDLAYHEKRGMHQQRENVILEKDAAVIDRNSAHSKLESAIPDRDVSCAEKQNLLDRALASLSSLMDEIGRWKSPCQKLQEENKQLLDTLETRNKMIALHKQHQSQLNNRVLALEHHQAAYASKRYVMVRPNGPKIKYIQNSATALFP